jgi:hypothetical protein
MAFTLSFAPTFQHEDWIDNQDRVQAAGDNGFNVRFNLIKADLADLATTVGEINVALNQLGQGPPSREVPIAVAPVLTSTGTEGWAHRIGFAEKPADQTSAAGMATVQLPHGSVVTRLRATGRHAGSGSLRISLMRQGIAADAPAAQRVARVEPAGDPFDTQAAADATLATVDNQAFRYFLLAQLNNAQAGDVVLLASFQIAVNDR